MKLDASPPGRGGRETMIGKTYLEKGKPVIVLIRWNGKGPRNVLIQREDDSKVVRPFRGLRCPKEAGGGCDR